MVGFFDVSILKQLLFFVNKSLGKILERSELGLRRIHTLEDCLVLLLGELALELHGRSELAAGLAEVLIEEHELLDVDSAGDRLGVGCFDGLMHKSGQLLLTYRLLLSSSL